MKYLYTLILTLFLASCSVSGSDSQVIDNKSNTENNSGEIMTPPDGDNIDRPELPEWGDDTERPEPPSRGERNTKSGVDTSTSAS